MPSNGPDLSNIQGLVTQSYHYGISRHLLFEFGPESNARGARTFLNRLVDAGVTTATQSLDLRPEPLINVGITYAGLKALKTDPEVVATLDHVFQQGAQHPDVVRALGDSKDSASDPRGWWERRFSGSQLHCIVNLYVHTKSVVDEVTGNLRSIAARCGVRELIPREDGTRLDGLALGHGRLHFGYTDGISQPRVNWHGETPLTKQEGFQNFLLGYSNDGASREQAVLSAPARDTKAAKFVKDSSYAVFRWLYQDVAAFNRFLRDMAPRMFPELPSADAEERLAAKLMGRWRDGTPLVLSPYRSDGSLAKRNDFGYAEDRQGAKCPFSAHIRVVNPRDQDLSATALVEGVPRVIRRGSAYGSELFSVQDDNVDRGVLGIFICSDIRRQFLVLSRWINKNDFSPVFNSNPRAQDAIAGNRSVYDASKEFCLSQGKTVTLRDFVRTKGTEFLLIPSLLTLRRLADAA